MKNVFNVGAGLVPARIAEGHPQGMPLRKPKYRMHLQVRQ